jgi:hypothetical protein
VPRRELTPPLTPEQLRPLGPNETIVQFKSPPTEDELRQVSALPPEPHGYARALRGENSTPGPARRNQPRWTGFRSA